MLTSHRGPLLIAYDRKSRRHNWRLIVSDLPEKRARVEVKAGQWAANARGKEGWEDYQCIIATVNITDGQLPDNLPRNYQWARAERGPSRHWFTCFDELCNMAVGDTRYIDDWTVTRTGGDSYDLGDGIYTGVEALSILSYWQA
jgi:hypothetical protein